MRVCRYCEIAQPCPEPGRGGHTDSVGPNKNYRFLDLLIRARGFERPPGGPPELSVGLPGTPGGLPEAPGA